MKALNSEERSEFWPIRSSVRSDCGRASPGAPACWRRERSILERRAAREVEELGLVVLAFMDRNRQVKADRAHRRVPNQTGANRGANCVRVVYLGAAQLRRGERPGN